MIEPKNTVTPLLTTEQEKRFWSKVEKTETCWIWKASHVRGYGRWRAAPKGKHYTAPRLSYQLHKGNIPDGLLVMHICDTPSCVNPDHLKIGTAQDNTDDMMSKGRHRTANGEKHGSKTHPERVVKGESQPLSKLNNQAVIQIRNMWDNGSKTHKQLAEIYGVSKSLIGMVLQRKIWKHI